MPFRCVAFNCSNEPNSELSLHKWPTDKVQADAWRRFVSNKRKDWKPSSESRLCSKHFTKDCFENQLQFSFGHCKKLLLRPGAVPTIHILSHSGIPTSSAVTSAGSCTVTTALSSCSMHVFPSQRSVPAECTLTASTSTTTMRSAVRKREANRVNKIFLQLSLW